MSHIIRGIVRSLDGSPVAGQRVVVVSWRDSAITSDVLAQSFTGRDGTFVLVYELESLALPVVACVVEPGGTLFDWSGDLNDLDPSSPVELILDRTRSGQASNSRVGPHPPRIEIDDKYSISGTVAWPDGTPAQGLTVRAANQRLRGETPLGPHAPTYTSETRTDTVGRYRILYDHEQLGVVDIGHTGLVVHVLNRSGTVVASSPTKYTAGRDAVIDVTVPNDAPGLPSEFERLVTRLTPVLESAPPTGLLTLSPQDLPYLIGASGVAETQLDALTTAVGLANDAAAVGPALDMAVFYGLVRSGDATDWTGLHQLDSAAIASTLISSAAVGVIPPLTEEEADSFASAISKSASKVAGNAIGTASPLIQPAALYAPTSETTNEVLDARLNAGLAAAVIQCVGSTSSGLALAMKIAAATLDWRKIMTATPAATVADAATAVLAQISQSRPDLSSEVTAIVPASSSSSSTTVSDALWLNTPLQQNVLLQPDLRAATAHQLAQLAGLDDAATAAVAAAAPALFAAPSIALSQLQTSGSITAAQATVLGAISDLGTLTSYHLPLMQSMVTAGNIDASVLAGWDVGQWTRQITAHATNLPPGETAASYAATMVANLELAYPTQSLVAQLVPGEAAAQSFFDNNPNIDVRQITFDATALSSLNWSGISDTAKSTVVATLHSFQRLMALADTTQDRVTLSRNGLDSAVAIASQTAEDFAANSGLDPVIAGLTYSRAVGLADQVAVHYGANRGILQGPFSKVPVNNVPPDLINALQEIDGYSDIFGSQNSCDCSDCQSVLSPAAYFVDLMYFTETQISNPLLKIAPQAKNPLYLKNRRGDLWTLVLNCNNTDTLVPYLEIVDDVLESYLGTVLSGGGPMVSPYQTIASPNNVVSCQVPFSPPYAELSLYLGYFSLRPADVYRVIQRPTSTINRAASDLSALEATVVATADTANIPQRLGVQNAADLDNFPVPAFLQRTAMSRAELTTMLASRFDPDLSGITVEQQPVAGNPQDYTETLVNLTTSRADRIHRRLRLAKPHGWELVDLDLLLFTAQGLELQGSDLSEDAVELVGRVISVQKSWSLTVQQACSLIGTMPYSTTYPGIVTDPGEKMLLEQVFDLATLLGTTANGLSYVQGPVPYYCASLDTAKPANPQDTQTPALLTALGISEADLLQLLELLSTQIPIDANGKGTIDAATLTLLYRHTLVAGAVGLGISDLIACLRLLLAPGALAITTLDQIEAIIQFSSWLAGSGFSVPQLSFIVNGALSTSVTYTNTPATVAAVVTGVLGSVTGAQPTPQQAPDLVPALVSQLASSFNVSAARLADLLAWVSSGPEVDVLAGALQPALPTVNPAVAPDYGPLLTLFQGLERAALLFSRLGLDDAGVGFVTAHPGQLGIADTSTPTLAAVQSLTSYAYFQSVTVAPSTGATSLGAASTPGSGTNAASLTQLVLTDYEANAAFNTADQSLLAALLGVPQSLIESIVSVYWSPAAVVKAPTVPLAALERMRDLVAFCTRLGVNAYSLQSFAADDFESIAQSAATVRSAIGAKYADASIRATTLAPFQNNVNMIKRDALCSYLVNGLPQLKFTNDDDLYNYFLLDVQMMGGAQTSRVVSATNSVQLYIQRCVLGLEKEAPPSKIAVDPSSVPTEQWAWMQNYRVWEANRQVFLYPEDYLLPDLRDDKTPTFSDLETVFLQTSITDDNAAAAYNTYLTNLSELGHLNIVGSSYDQASGTYYFFGRTQQDPPVFYYRTWDETIWSPWLTVDLPIDGPYVSSIIFHGQLFVFWVDATTQDRTAIKKAASVPDGTAVTVDLAFSTLEPDGTWRSPQKVPWLYPSKTENSKAVSTIDTATVGFLVGSKTYRKAYPCIVGEQLNLFYGDPVLVPPFWAIWPGPGEVFARRLDLFHNSLIAGTAVPTLLSSRVVILNIVSTGGGLGGELVMGLGVYESEIDFDSMLSIRVGASAFITPLTSVFAHDPIIAGDPGMVYIIHAVVGRFPESVVQLGDQQFLIHNANDLYQIVVQEPNSSGSNQTTEVADVVRSAQTPGQPAVPPHVDVPVAFVNLLEKRVLVRLSTSVADFLGQQELTGKTVAGGLNQLFDLTTQIEAKEAAPSVSGTPVSFLDLFELAPPRDDPNHIDLSGAFGDYFEELYFHIPWLAANLLNAAGQYEYAMKWFQRIFDPTASSSSYDVVETDRNWRFVGFRGLTVPTLQAMLTDAAALKAYEDDPFEPFAIARIRPLAFQKAIVMQFVDNLMDWADSLFIEDTMESVGEATMLYVYASEILGPQPQALGPCPTVPDEDLTYAKIGPSITSTSSVLIDVENTVVLYNFATSAVPSAPTGGPWPKPHLLDYQVAKNLTISRMQPTAAASVLPKNPGWGFHVVQQTFQVFCVPPDTNLQGYWKRVQTSLGRIRNSENFSGVPQTLALFAPPIDPMALVRAVAAGLTIEAAVAAVTNPPTPLYRFTALMDRARQAAQTVSSFGSQLLSALEKKDGEELTLLRSLHEQVILQQTTQIKTASVEEAQYQVAASAAALQNVQNKITYYQGLISSGLNAYENAEVASQVEQITDHLSSKGLQLEAAIAYLIANLGSPFSLNYGGKQIGDAYRAGAEQYTSAASVAGAEAAAASTQASFMRRSDEWKQQLTLAQEELLQSTALLNAAQLRATNAQGELDLHTTSIAQAAELDAFYKGKFTKLGLYTYLAQNLQSLYRMSYLAAYQLAMQAQAAFTFELESLDAYIQPNNWESDTAGLLSGERLQLQLVQLENAYLTGNNRLFEITQSFPLSLIAPVALSTLRETGSCTFDIPEILFDVVYPGQYQRVIKSVRVTIPGVTGPYTNVGATLSLTANYLRPNTDLASWPGDPAKQLQAPAGIATTSIATSSGINDGGLFELNFRDERYLPFEGAGAVSSWTLTLPSTLRPFDYESISDIIMTLSYTSHLDLAFTDTVETGLTAAFKTFATETGLRRLFSLKRDFPDAYAQLTSNVPGTPTPVTASIEIGPRSFPYFLSRENLTIKTVQLKLVPAAVAPAQTGPGPAAMPPPITINGKASEEPWATGTDGLPTASVALTGPASGTWTIQLATPGDLDPTKTGDLLILLQYQLS